ncbi:MAG TPA: hypothetical protein VGG36_01970 [Rhizomicrobium sp.]|jgi:hypothetical protein
MEWFIPPISELLRRKADGRARPITGPRHSQWTTFAWKRVSPREPDFHASQHGVHVEQAVETLALDASTFTDALWSPAHPDQKDISVFFKREQP